MNLSNEKNTLLNTVSRLAVSFGARASVKFVTRGAMAAAALTVATYALVDTNPAIASCTPAVGTVDNPAGVVCGDNVAGGFDSDGYDLIDLDVRPDSRAEASTGLIFNPGKEADSSDNNTVIIFDTDPAGFKGTNPGLVNGTNGDGILIEGDGNLIRNGTGVALGGGTIQGTDDGIDIDGINNEVTNISNGFDGPSIKSGVITGGGNSSSDGIEVSGGTSGNANIINNGVVGSKTAYIVSGGTPSATNVDGDDGIDADGWTTVNNGKLGVIHGEDRGIEFSGVSGDTLTVDNDGKIIGDKEDGINVKDDGLIVNYSGAGTLSGGREVGGSDGAGIDIATNVDSAKVNVTFDKGGLIEGYSHGIELGPDGDNNILVLKGEGTIEGDGNSGSDGIHVNGADSNGNDITLDGKILVQGKDDGVDLGSGNKLTVTGASTVQGDTDGSGGGDGIQANDDNTIKITGASKVIGDPGILADDNNTITVDGGSDVTGNPEDGINVDDENTILIGGAGGAGTVYGKGANSDGIALTDEFDNSGGGQDDNSVTIGKAGTVDAQRDGIVVGQVGDDNEDNSVLIQDGGNVIAGRDGIVVNAQDEDADGNTVTIDNGGQVNAKGDGVRLLGDDQVTTALDALAGGDFFGDSDGSGNDLVNKGIIRAGDDGVLVSNTNSDVDNSGGEIYAGSDGVRFTTIHTDEVDNDGGNVDESGYQSDSNSVIVAGRDGIHYDNAADDGADADFGAGKGQDVNGLGEIDNPIDLLFGISGYYPEVVENEGLIEAGRHGISVNDDFEVTNYTDGIIVAGGLPGKTATGGDGINADANNTITNYGIIASGLTANGDSNGIEVTGESNTITNEGIIDTRGDTYIAKINNTTLEFGTGGLQDNGAGGDGIHATVDGLSLKGFVDGYDQQKITNSNTIIAADDGIDVKSGGFGPGLEQLITNDDEATITADDDGIVAKHYNIIVNEDGGVINADDDDEGGGDGINVGHSNVVTNDGDINAGLTGNGIVMDGQKGPFSFGNLVTNTGDIDVGLDGIQVNGEQNYIENSGNIKGGRNGVALNDEENDFVSTAGTIEGGTGAGIYSDEDNDIELSGTTFVTSTFGKGGDGIVLEDDNSLEIEDGVKVHGDNDGIVLEGDDNDVDYEGDGVNGVAELKGRTGDALRIDGDSNTFDSSDALDLQGGDDGIEIGGNANSVDIDGNVGGEDDGIYLDTATGNVITVGGNVTGDSDDNGSGDGVDIDGGGSNTVTVSGAISGDPGVIITNSDLNKVSGASITGTDGGVIIDNGNSNIVKATAGNIAGGTGDGVGIIGSSNIVSASQNITGSDGVDIEGSTNQVSTGASYGITGTWDGVSVDGDSNIVKAGTGGITGNKGEGVQIDGKSNIVSTDGHITSNWLGGTGDAAVEIDGNLNEVSADGHIHAESGIGVDISGKGNIVEAGDYIYSGEDDGVYIDGSQNTVTAGSYIEGYVAGAELHGNGNLVSANGDIEGNTSDGVYIGGDGNDVETTGSIIGGGDEGVDIDGSNNSVNAEGLAGSTDGADVRGNNNELTIGEDGIRGENGDGLYMFGLNNSVLSNGIIEGQDRGVALESLGSSVVAFGQIIGEDGNGVDIGGNNNSVASVGEDSGIRGGEDGVRIEGNGNEVQSNDFITGTAGDGVDIEGDSNTVEAEGDVSGGDDGVRIFGASNQVTVDGDVTGTNGDGVDIGGVSNTVKVSGAITGDPGVIILGNNNSVSGASIEGTVDDGVKITGSSNNVGSLGAIKGATDGIEIFFGSNNTITAGSVYGGKNGALLGSDNDLIITGKGTSIEGANGVGVKVSGNSSVTAAFNNVNILGSTTGADVDGNNNVISAGGTIVGTTAIGLDIDGNSNTVNTSGITGGTHGATIDGTSNNVTVGAGGITGKNGDGLAITGGSNTVVSGGTVIGTDDGVEIDGSGNGVSVTGGITGSNGQGVDIAGNSNTVSATGNILGPNDTAVQIVGDDNNVSSGADIVGAGNIGVSIDGNGNDVSGVNIAGFTGGGALIKGNQNTVGATEDISTTSGFGVGITGNQNVVTAGDDIKSNNNDGVNIAGNQNQVTANDIYGGIDGIQINGNQNFVDAAATVTGVAGNGVHFDSGTGNNVDLTNVTVTAGLDGILLDVDGNEFQHNSATVINAGDDGIEYEYGGLVNAYESLVWLGTINASDDGIVADSGFFTIINNGTINADKDKNSDGNGITVTSDNTVENNGTITGWNGIVGDDRNIITNDKTITVDNDGIQVDDDNKVINNGTITAGDDGIQVGDKNYVENNSSLTINAKDNGIDAGSLNTIVNTGVINADSDDNNDGDGINAVDSNEITNTDSGDIEGWNGIVVDDSNKVTNDGDISGENNGIVGDDSNTVVNNDDIDAGNIGVSLDDLNSLENNGSIEAGNIGVQLGFDNIVNNNVFALIEGGEDGIVLLDGFNEVNNDWTISGIDGDGVDIQSNGNLVNNEATGAILGGDDGIEISGSSNTVNNSGTIDGEDDGVAIQSGSSNVINNSYRIEGTNDGVDIDSNSNFIYNYSGLIIGVNDDGVDIDADNNYVYNLAWIDGSDNGIEIGGDDNEVVSYGEISGGNDGINIIGEDNYVINHGAVTGDTDDGIDINGDNNDVYNTGGITGEDEGIEVVGSNTNIQNGTSGEDNASIWGQEGDGIDIDSGTNNSVINYGSITGFWQGIDNAEGDMGSFLDEEAPISYGINNIGGSITGQNSDGIRSNIGDDDNETVIRNVSDEFVGENFDQGTITGADDGIDVGGAGLYVENGVHALIQGVDDGIHTTATRTEIYNDGKIIGGHTGITDGSDFEGEDFNGQSTYIVNGTTGTITGGEAGYLYEDGSYNGGDETVQIDNFGIISATDKGTLPTPLVDDPLTKDVDESKGTLNYIDGKGADPVAAIDTRQGEEGLEVYVFNWGTINGANDFSAEVPAVADDPATKDVDETKAAIPPQQLTNRFAILGGEGNEYVANFDGGKINGDIFTQSGDDVLALEIGSTLNGNVNLGQTLETGLVLGLIKDDPTTKDVDESAGGTAVGFVSTPNVDTGLDTVILFGEGYQDLASNITEAEVMYVNDQITQGDVYSVGPEDGILMATAIGNPVLENQPFPVGTWSLNGNVKIDGTNVWTFVDVDGNGNGVVDEESSTKDETIAMITGTVGTVVDNGRLNVGGTVITEIPGEPTDEETGELEPSTYEVTTNSTAVLTSPVVDVWSGGILGGHGTIVTNPGANGGNGGVNLTGAVQGDKTVYVGADEEHIDEQFLPSEARGAYIIGTTPVDILDAKGDTVDLVTQDENGVITDKTKGDGEPDFKLVTVDSIGNLYPNITLPAGWVSETFSGPFDFTTDSPRYATLAPGDEITRIGTLTVVGNVTMDDKEIKTTTWSVKVAVDANKDGKQDVDGKGDPVFEIKTQTGRDVVTNWGSQFQADLRDDGKGDRLNVKKSGVTTAFTGSTFDTTGPGTVDLVTQDAKGVETDKTKGDGVPDFDIVTKDSTDTKVDRLVAGKGKADGVPDGVSYKVSTVLDGHASVDGRLDIRLDGEFVDLVDNSQTPLIDDPEGPTGCGDDPDGADSCPQVPNPLYAIPDGIADVDAKGVAKNNADFSKDAKVWDIIVAEGGVSGKFDEKGFDGGPNDGAVVVRYPVADDPSTEEDETVTEMRVQLLKAYLQYLPDRVRIISIPAFGPKGETINQIATGEYLDTLTKYGLNEDPLHAVIALVGTATDIPAALDALHPEWYNAFNEVGFSIARGAEQQAYIRTIEAQGFSGGQQNRVVMNVGDDSAVGSSASDRRATFWLAGSWGNASIDDGSNEGWLEYKYETLTGYAGFDYLINPNFLLGIMGGFSNSDVDAKNGSGNEGDVDSWQVSGYVSYFTSNWFVNAGGGIGDMNIESIRNIQFGSGIGNISQVATADYDGDITFFYGKGGYSFDLGNSGWKLSPELALSYAKVKQDGFSEGGTGNAAVVLLDVDGQSVESLRGTAQLRLSKTFMSGNGGGWMPYARVGVANEFEDELRPITSGFQGAPGTSFTVFGKVPRETTVIFGAGVTGKVNEMFSLYLDYSGEIGGSFTEHVISGGVRLSF